MTGTWDPILPLPSTPSFILSFSALLYPLLLYAFLHPLLSNPTHTPLTRLDGILVSLSLSFLPLSFIVLLDGLPLRIYLRLPPSPFPFFLRHRYSFMRTYHGILYSLSLFLSFSLETLFLFSDKCKTKTYLCYSLCKYVLTATRMARVFPSRPLSRLFVAAVYYYSRHLLLTTICTIYTVFGERIRRCHANATETAMGSL